jgi:hypothetical protein
LTCLPFHSREIILIATPYVLAITASVSASAQNSRTVPHGRQVVTSPQIGLAECALIKEVRDRHREIARYYSQLAEKEKQPSIRR